MSVSDVTLGKLLLNPSYLHVTEAIICLLCEYQWAEDKQARGERIDTVIQEGLTGLLGGGGAQLTACDPLKAYSFTP